MTNYIKSKSKSWQVKDLHGYIVDHLNEDDDYWHGGGGDSDINRKLIDFDDYAWLHLEQDLTNWTNDQRFILANAVRRGDDNNEASKIVSKRSHVFALVINLADDNILTDLLDDLNFLQKHEDQVKEVLVAVKDRLGKLKATELWKDYYHHWYSIQVQSVEEWLNNKIKEASR